MQYAEALTEEQKRKIKDVLEASAKEFGIESIEVSTGKIQP